MKTSQIPFLFCLIFIPLKNFAQLENANWCFGLNAKANINTQTTGYSAMQTNYSADAASVSDQNGNLLFYTDGYNIFGSNNQVITNGSQINGYYGGIVQNLLIVPKPCHPGMYYLFTLSTVAPVPTNENSVGLGGIHYTVVDMTSGAGRVPQGLKNVPISNQAGQRIEYNIEPYDYNNPSPFYLSIRSRMTATKSSTGDKIWVAMMPFFVNQNSRMFYNFLVDANGINNQQDGNSPSPTVEMQLNNSNYTSYYAYSLGSMKISPSGNLLSDAEESVVNLYDFDNTTGLQNSGKISFSRQVYSSSWDGTHGVGYGIEFSPNNQLIYFTDNPFNIMQGGLVNYHYNTQYGSIYQSNLATKRLYLIYTNNVSDIVTPIPTHDAPWGLQLGIDNKIYATLGGSNMSYLAAIQSPNNPGTSCNFTPTYLQLAPGTYVSNSLPQWIHVATGCPCIPPVVTPGGPIDYWLAADAVPVIGFQLVSDKPTGNQWYYNNTPISGATGQTYSLGSGYSSLNSGDYYALNGGCQSNIVHVNYKLYGYGNYGEESFTRLGSNIYPIQTSAFYCYNSSGNAVQQFNLGTGASYSWNFKVSPANGTQNVSLTPGSSNPSSNLAQLNIGNSTGNASQTNVQGVATLPDGRVSVLEYLHFLSHPDFISSSLSVCTNANQYITNWAGSSYSTLPGASGFDWEEYDFGANGTIYSGPGAGQHSVIIPGKSTAQQMIVRFSGPSFVQKHFYYTWGGCYEEHFNVSIQNGCLSGQGNLENNISKIFPNPASDIVNIKSKQIITDIEISDIFNPVVRKIRSIGQKEIQFTVTALKPGIYNCKITTASGIEHQKLIIRRN